MQRNLLKDNSSLLDAALHFADPVLVMVTGALAYHLYFDSWEMPARYVAALFGAAMIAFVVFAPLKLYQSQRGISFAEELRSLLVAWVVIGMSGGAFLFLAKSGADFSRAWVVIWMTLGFVAHAASRAAIRYALRGLRRRGRNLRHIVIVGAGSHARAVASRLRAAPWSGLNVRGFYDDDKPPGTEIDGITVIGPCDRLGRDLDRHDIDQVWVALPLRAEARIRELLSDLRQTTAQVRFVPDIHGFHLLHHSVTEVAGMPVLNLTDSPHSGVNSGLKTAEDIVLSVILFLITAPLWLLIAIGVKLGSRGPVFYRQERVTWNGRRFAMLKFRTMPHDVEARSGAVWNRAEEHRATSFGRFLRRFSLDELPQVLNVLRRDMSLVGPRPERPEFVERFRQQIPGYMQKHLVKAGITGWAQVNDLRGDSDLAQRIQYDLYYIDHWSLWFDLRILALTLWHILTSRNAR